MLNQRSLLGIEKERSEEARAAQEESWRVQSEAEHKEKEELRQALWEAERARGLAEDDLQQVSTAFFLQSYCMYLCRVYWSSIKMGLFARLDCVSLLQDCARSIKRVNPISCPTCLVLFFFRYL